MPSMHWLFAVLIGFGSLSAAHATNVTMPEEGVETHEVITLDTPDIPVPESGLSQEQVEARFGAPQAIIPPVGDPPITRWQYAQFTVYFEYNYVIHSVAKPLPQ